MKKRTVSVLAVLLLVGAVGAAGADDLTQIRADLQSLTERLDRLERENAALRAENHVLKSGAVSPAAGTVDIKPAAAQGTDWQSRIALKGDLRYRHQQTDDARAAAERYEHVLRARFQVDAKVADQLAAAIGFSTSEAGNPRGANVRLDGAFSRKPFYLDLGYFDWTFAPGAHAIGGKMKMPFVRPGQSLFWDNDVNPEGVAVTYGAGSMFGSVYGFWIDENVQSGATALPGDTRDTMMYGTQIGGRFDFSASRLIAAAMYYDLSAAKGRRPFFSGPNGNSVTSTGALANDFRVFAAMMEYNAMVSKLPLQVWIDFARNQSARLDQALAAGMLVGKAADANTWEVGLGYQTIDKDALFAQHIDSDFAAGVSDSEGWMLRAGYAPRKNWSFNATYYPAAANKDVGDEYDVERLLMDFNAKF